LEELELRPAVPGGIYPVLFGGLAGGDMAFELIEMPSGFQMKSQNNIPEYTSKKTDDSKGGGGIAIYSLAHFMTAHNLTTRGFDVAKIDCEYCEYMLIPANKEIFSNRKLVKRLVGELHPYEICKRILALNGTSSTSSTSAQQEVLDVLDKRGCPLSLERDFDDNHNIGFAKPVRGRCCPELCPNE
jgi:hypothetical protein